MARGSTWSCTRGRRLRVGYAVDACSAAADAELKALHAEFTIDVKDAHFFLGNNIFVHQGGAP